MKLTDERRTASAGSMVARNWPGFSRARRSLSAGFVGAKAPVIQSLHLRFDHIHPGHAVTRGGERRDKRHSHLA